MFILDRPVLVVTFIGAVLRRRIVVDSERSIIVEGNLLLLLVLSVGITTVMKWTAFFVNKLQSRVVAKE